MSRIVPAAVATPAWTRAAWALAALDGALLLLAISLGDGTVRDGGGSVTNGWTVSAGIVATLAGMAALPFTAIPAGLARQVQAFGLGAQALHAAGHLLGLYYSLPFYDDVLHFGLVLVIGLLIAEALRLPDGRSAKRPGPVVAGALVWVGATAAAGVWEIFEFAMDGLLGTREQDNLFDTMVDMVDGTLGGLVAGALTWRRQRLDAHAKRLGDARSDELLD